MEASLFAWPDSNVPLKTHPKPPSPIRLAILKFRVAAVSCRRVNLLAEVVAASVEIASAPSNSELKQPKTSHAKP